MTSKKLNEFLQQGEGLEIEFKTSRFELNKNVFESVCAFLNRKGGHLLLGINNNGKAEGVMENCIPQKLNPPVYLSAQVLEKL